MMGITGLLRDCISIFCSGISPFFKLIVGSHAENLKANRWVKKIGLYVTPKPDNQHIASTFNGQFNYFKIGRFRMLDTILLLVTFSKFESLF